MARFPDISIRVTAAGCIWIAVMLLLMPLPWLCAWVIAAAVHELFHCAALFVCGKPITAVTIDTNGAKIQTGTLSDQQTLLCALSGPVGGFMLLSFSDTFPKLTLCAMVQSAFNLLPVYPLDGGQALLAAARMLFGERTAQRICRAAQILVIGAGLVLGTIGSFLWKLGLMPAVMAVIFAAHLGKIKIPCK